MQRVLADPELGADAQVRAGRRQQHRADAATCKPLVLKVEVHGPRAWSRTAREAMVVEAGAGENWHDFVAWTLDQGCPGLENLALIPGTVGAVAGAEHRRLRGRAAGPLRVAGRDRPASPAATFTLDAAPVRLRLPRLRVQARGRRGRRFRPGRPGADPARALAPAQALEAGAGLPGPGAQDARDRHPRSPTRAADLRLGLRHPQRQAARPARDRQRRQLLQEPDRHARAVPATSSPATRTSCTTRCPTAASSWPPAG